MTILKFQPQGDKQNLVEKQSLSDVKTAAENSQNEQRRKRKIAKRWVIGLTFFLFVIVGAFGGTLIWFRWHRRTRVTVECTFHNSYSTGKFNQTIEYNPADKITKIQVSKLGDFSRATIVHDFDLNLTAIADRDNEQCFVLPLDRQSVIPPKNMFDLIIKMQTGYYKPDVLMIEKQFNVELPAITNIDQFGPYIKSDCSKFTTWRLVEKPQRSKRSVGCPPLKNHLGYCLGSTNDESMNCITVKC